MLSPRSFLTLVVLAAASVCVFADEEETKVPNDTTKFGLAWLIIWVLLTVALLVGAGIKLVKLPHLIKGNKMITIVMIVLQLIVFVFVLAALAHNSWSTKKRSFGGLSVKNNYGLTKSWGEFATVEYSDLCSGENAEGKSQEWKDYCATIRAAGAFVLLFGIVGIIAAFVLLVVAILSLVGMSAVAPVVAFVPILANVQWICVLAMVMLWGVSGHVPLAESLKGGEGDFELGASWALAFIAMVFAIVVAFFFAGGAGENLKGASTGAAAAPAGQQPVQWSPPQQQAPEVVVQPTH